MPPIPKKGQIIHGYKILEHLNKGAMANAFAAADTRNDGRKMFFKSYISPTPALDWYRKYIDYVAEINKRLNNPGVRQFCVKTIELFEAPLSSKSRTKFFFQVFEFIEGGHDLESLMAKAVKQPDLLPWDTRLTMAKVFMAGLKNLHVARVVHADLKPANIQMLPDPSTKIGFKPRLIDMDFSLLDDKTAPWDGKVGYVGTPGYYSPEHLDRRPGRNIPHIYSDVFTSGIILCELLAGSHPYAGRYGDIEEYRDAVMAGDHQFKDGLPLMGKVAASDDKTSLLADTIMACLSPDASLRPDASVVHRALLGRLESSDEAPASKPAEAAKKSSSTPCDDKASGSLIVKGDIGEVRYRVSGTVGRSNLGAVSSEARFASHDQFKLERHVDGMWSISPCPDATNWTTINGSILKSTVKLEGQAEIGLQSRTTDRTAMPITLIIS